MNDFSRYREKIDRGLEQAGLSPEGYEPQAEDDFLKRLSEREPDAIIIAVGVSETPPVFYFKRVQEQLTKRNIKTPLWMVVRPEDEKIAAEAMYEGLADYFFTDRLTRLTLLLTRLASRQRKIFKPVKLNPILEGVIEEYQPFFQAKGLSLTFLPGVDLPLFLGNQTALLQAILSVLGNVMEAAPPGTKADARSYLDAVKGEVCLEIKLSGEGLRTEKQIEGTAVSETTLSAPTDIVEAQNGRLDVEWGEEAGIRILLAFPAILGKQMKSNYKLLIVENSLLMRTILQEALEQEGFMVQTAENGAEALEIMSGYQPDLVISDIVMPVMDGFAFFEAVRARPEWVEIPFIFVTGQSDQKEHLNAQVLRGATYLIKPIVIEELFVAVQSRLPS